jgi:hypothetical protein
MPQCLFLFHYAGAIAHYVSATTHYVIFGVAMDAKNMKKTKGLFASKEGVTHRKKGQKHDF